MHPTTTSDPPSPVTAGLADKVTSAWIDNDAVGSDHNPIWFELDL